MVYVGTTTQELMISIIKECLNIDKEASLLYRKIAEHTVIEEQKKFWLEIAEDEVAHTQFWDGLLEWSQNGMLPQIFDEPDVVFEELLCIKSKIGSLTKSQYFPPKDLAQSFLLAFKLEFYLLHPAFESLYQYLKSLIPGKEKEDFFDNHLTRLFEALASYELVTIELELLGEAIYRIWEENKKLAAQSKDDPLTKVLNRRGLFNAIVPLSHLAQRNQMNIGIMMADIDNFKKINDSFGHQFGDRILKHVASTIHNSVRNSDVVGRYGGEEFLIFLSQVEPDFIHAVGEKIRKSVEEGSKDHAGITISIGVSQGTIESWQVEKELNELIRIADKNLYKAKETGKNKVIS